MLSMFSGMDQALDYALQKLPSSCGQELLESVNEAGALCAEASRLTSECRDAPGARFEPTIIDSTPPALLIQVFLPPAGAPVDASLATESAVAPCFWSLQELRERVQRMRSFERRRPGDSSPASDASDVGSLMQGVLDPWQQAFNLADVAQYVAHLENALSEATQSRAKLFTKTLALWHSRRDHVCLGQSLRSWAGPTLLGASEGTAGGSVPRRGIKVAKPVSTTPATQAAAGQRQGSSITFPAATGDRSCSAGPLPRRPLRGNGGRQATPVLNRRGSAESEATPTAPQALRPATPRTRTSHSPPRSRPTATPAPWRSGKSNLMASVKGNSRSSGSLFQGGPSWSAGAVLAGSAANAKSKAAATTPSPKPGPRTISIRRWRETPPRTPSPASRFNYLPVRPADLEANPERAGAAGATKTNGHSEGLDADYDLSEQASLGELRQLRGELREMCSSLRLRLTCSETSPLSSPSSSRQGMFETRSGQLSDVSGGGFMSSNSRGTLIANSSAVLANSAQQQQPLIQHAASGSAMPLITSAFTGTPSLLRSPPSAGSRWMNPASLLTNGAVVASAPSPSYGGQPVLRGPGISTAAWSTGQAPVSWNGQA